MAVAIQYIQACIKESTVNNLIKLFFHYLLFDSPWFENTNWFHFSYLSFLFFVSCYCFVQERIMNESGSFYLLCVLVIFCSMLFLLQFSCFLFHSLTTTLLLSIYHYPTNEHLTSSITALRSHHNVLACSSLAPIVSMQIAMLGLGMGKQANCSNGCACARGTCISYIP